MGEPYWQDNMRTLYCGDARSMSEIPDESVQCVVTSPPYWGLRKYSGVPDLIWGGEPECQHEWDSDIQSDTRAEAFKHWGNYGSGGEAPHIKVSQGSFCSLCGAWKGSYGLEPTPQMYVQHTVEILREIRRVLRPDGVVFWNIRDSYASDGKWGGVTGGKHAAGLHGETGIGRQRTWTGLPPINLCLIPQRVAIAAQEDGWHVVSEIIWEKPNPMPESVRRRPTRSHEHIWMLTKNAKYYWDQEAVREAQSPNTHARGAEPGGRASQPGPKSATREDSGIAAWLQVEADQWTKGGRNIRSVWTFPTQPYAGSHHATFPERLPEICIKAATPEVGCCEKCAAPWERVVEAPDQTERPLRATAKGDGQSIHTRWGGYPQSAGQEWQGWRDAHPNTTTGWQPTCECGADKVPSLVVDPFAGTGTTLKVAARLGRQVIGYEISREYCELAVERNQQGALDFVSETPGVPVGVEEEGQQA